APQAGEAAEPAAQAPEPALPESATVPAGWLPDGAEALFGEGARAEEAYGLLTVDVPPASWTPALETARDTLGCRFFDWLSAVDEPGTGFQVCAHLVALPEPAEEPGGGGAVRRLLLRTTVPHEAPALPTATPVFAGAAWHERETHEMFGVTFTGHPALTPLLLPDSFEGHPLRKDFVLAARVAKAWPGAVEPGESADGAPKRRQMLPPGVPDPNEWGPLKGQLPPVPSRPARGRAGRAGAGAGAAASGERPARPARRTRSASAGSASQRGTEGSGETGATAGNASASGAPTSGTPVSDTPTSDNSAPDTPTSGPRASDAPWHESRPSTGESRPSSGEEARNGEEERDGEDTGRGKDTPRGEDGGDGPKGGA
ncbi:NADH-quinone oxidoreductase subunit C, partial [Streptomyces nanshensis]|uniref:NADH-quinone oxidoreductase subunit C n=1 Tax=Streptomyces nanshensis TaxID=518642 RepID=UPI000A9A8BD1